MGARRVVISSAAYLAWVVRPESRCVESPIGDELLPAVAELHAAYGAALFRRRNQSYARQLEHVPELADDDLLACAKLEHELDHIQRNCATSYGFLIHRLYSHRVRLFFERAKMAKPQSELRLPLFPTTIVRESTDPLDINGRDFADCGHAIRILVTGYRAATAPVV
jgi:hypothetical protein